MVKQHTINISNCRAFYNSNKELYIKELGMKWHGMCPFYSAVDEDGDHNICPLLLELYWEKDFHYRQTAYRQPDIEHNSKTLSCYKFHCIGILHTDCPLASEDFLIKIWDRIC